MDRPRPGKCPLQRSSAPFYHPPIPRRSNPCGTFSPTLALLLPPPPSPRLHLHFSLPLPPCYNQHLTSKSLHCSPPPTNAIPAPSYNTRWKQKQNKQKNKGTTHQTNTQINQSLNKECFFQTLHLFTLTNPLLEQSKKALNSKCHPIQHIHAPRLKHFQPPYLFQRYIMSILMLFHSSCTAAFTSALHNLPLHLHFFLIFFNLLYIYIILFIIIIIHV